MDEVDHRCLAMAQVKPGVWKRCVRADGHAGADPWAESHLWAEAWNVADGRPMLVRWDSPCDAAPTIAEVHIRP